MVQARCGAGSSTVRGGDKDVAQFAVYEVCREEAVYRHGLSRARENVLGHPAGCVISDACLGSVRTRFAVFSTRRSHGAGRHTPGSFGAQVHPSLEGCAHRHRRRRLSSAATRRATGVSGAGSRQLSRSQPSRHQIEGEAKPWLRNFHTKVLDGNSIAATQNRIAELRTIWDAPLPGRTLVAWDHA